MRYFYILLLIMVVNSEGKKKKKGLHSNVQLQTTKCVLEKQLLLYKTLRLITHFAASENMLMRKICLSENMLFELSKHFNFLYLVYQI